MIRLTTRFFPQIYRPPGLVLKTLSKFSTEDQETGEEDKENLEEEIEGQEDSSQPLTKQQRKALKRKLRHKKRIEKLANEEGEEPDFQNMAIPKEEQHKIYGSLLRIEQDSDSEIGLFPLLTPGEEESQSVSESDLMKVKQSNIYKTRVPSIREPHEGPTYKMMCYLKHFDEIYKNEESFKWDFLFKFMRADMATQMMMFPHKLEEQSFDLPLNKSKQIKYLQDLVERTEFLRQKPFRVPHSKKFGESIEKEVTNFKELALKELKGFVRMIREAKENQNDVGKKERINKILGYIKANFSSIIKEAFHYKAYHVMSIKDFRSLLVNEDFLPISHILFEKELFVNNPAFVTNSEISELFKSVLKNKNFMKNLEVSNFFSKIVNL